MTVLVWHQGHRKGFIHKQHIRIVGQGSGDAPAAHAIQRDS